MDLFLWRSMFFGGFWGPKLIAQLLSAPRYASGATTTDGNVLGSSCQQMKSQVMNEMHCTGQQFGEISFGGYNTNRMSTPLSWFPVVRPEMGYWQARLENQTGKPP
eukprot:2171906-Amphidinium_carterae.1